MSVEIAQQKFVAGSGVSLQLNEYTESGRVFRNWKFHRILNNRLVDENGDLIGGEKTAREIPASRKPINRKDVKGAEKKIVEQRKVVPKKASSECDIDKDMTKKKGKEGKKKETKKEPSECDIDKSLAKNKETKKKEEKCALDKCKKKNANDGKKDKTEDDSDKNEILSAKPSEASYVKARSPLARRRKQQRVEEEEKRDLAEEMMKRAVSFERIQKESRDQKRRVQTLPSKEVDVSEKKEKKKEMKKMEAKKEPSECDVDKALNKKKNESSKDQEIQRLNKMYKELQEQMQILQNQQNNSKPDSERIRAFSDAKRKKLLDDLVKTLRNLCDNYRTLKALCGDDLPKAGDRLKKLQEMTETVARMRR